MTSRRWPPGSSPDEELIDVSGPGLTRLTGDDPERIDRIGTEFAVAFHAMADVTKAVSLFGSARTPVDSPEYNLARTVAAQLGTAGFTIITGGGPGIMEAGNRGARDVGARSVGLNIELPFEQHNNPHLDLSLQFDHFFVRKVMFVRYASAFVVLPGGFGTLDELFEALTLIQTQTIRNFPVVLVGTSFWCGLIDWARDQLLGTGKIGPGDLDLLRIVDDPDEVVAIAQAAYEAQSEATLARPDA